MSAQGKNPKKDKYFSEQFKTVKHDKAATY
jgi:hypothetical protein